MKLVWEYSLPQSERPRDYEYEGPILARSGRVYYAGYAAPEIRSQSAARYVVRLHRIDPASGTGEWTDFEVLDPRLPGNWSLTAAGERVWFHCGALIDATDTPDRLTGISEGNLAPEKLASRPSPLVLWNHLLSTNEREGTLNCFDSTSREQLWSHSLKSEKPYRLGNPQRIGEQIACYGRDALLTLDPVSGEVSDEIRIPRVDKVYSPLAHGDDLLLGYTNWSAAGVIRYHRPTRKVVWQYRKKFEGPNSYCRIWLMGDVVVWVKGETELIGVDAATGEERWRTWASPYLYSPLEVIGTDLLFGTAGRGGAVQVVDGLTGETRWRQPLNNGCEYLAVHAGSVLVGDFDGFVRRLDLQSGSEIDQLSLGTEIVGDISVDGDRVYTVAWPDEESPARLVCISLD